MSHDTPADAPYAMGPPRDRTNTQGAELVREVLAGLGIRKTGDRWTTPNSEGARP